MSDAREEAIPGTGWDRPKGLLGILGGACPGMTATMVIREKVWRIFAEKLLLSVHSSDEDLLDSGLLDSVRLVELLMHLEQTFGISFDVASLEIESLRTIGAIAHLVANLKPEE